MLFSKKLSVRVLLSLLVVMLFGIPLFAQENTASLNQNILLSHPAKPTEQKHIAAKPSALSLPFFEDFTNEGPYPDDAKWADKCAWVNNNMPRNPVSRGAATLDALDWKGVPYDTTQPFNTLFADSLTSLKIDLSGHSPGDSVYLSFYYQAGGNGFKPKPQDSLILLFHLSNGVWQQVWAHEGDTVSSRFRQVMVPVVLQNCFYDSFEFRFVNKATIGISNSQWNIDYIRLAANRNILDTLINDVAFTTTPASMLNDFTMMPYKHFATNPSSFLKTELRSTFQNNGFSPGNINYGYNARILGGAATGNGSGSFGNLPYQVPYDAVFQMYNPVTSSQPQFTIENKYYLSDIYPGAPRDNDTIIQHQIFTNAFAYDDGTAEQAYYLSLNDNVPGKIAIEYAMYVPDTLRGVAIRFARQVPSAYEKQFSIVVYRDIAINGGSNNIIYQQDYFTPRYEADMNGLSVYAFDQGIPMDAGIYYVGIVFPAGGFSDSLMIALDVNRTNGNHRYYSVFDQWNTSIIEGALMVRPLVGAPLPLAVQDLNQVLKWNLYPNPANDQLTVDISSAEKIKLTYNIADISGRIFQAGSINKNLTQLHTQSLASGLYFLKLIDEHGATSVQKFIKTND